MQKPISCGQSVAKDDYMNVIQLVRIVDFKEDPARGVKKA